MREEARVQGEVEEVTTGDLQGDKASRGEERPAVSKLEACSNDQEGEDHSSEGDQEQETPAENKFLLW